MSDYFKIKNNLFSSGFWIKAWILVILGREELHGYEIMNRLNEFSPGFLSCKRPSHMGRCYKILRMLEMEGLISSKWEMQKEGPARRVYRISEDGERFRKSIIKNIEENLSYIKKFIEFSKEKEV